jgi:hypothetical protein
MEYLFSCNQELRHKLRDVIIILMLNYIGKLQDYFLSSPISYKKELSCMAGQFFSLQP